MLSARPSLKRRFDRRAVSELAATERCSDRVMRDEVWSDFAGGQGAVVDLQGYVVHTSAYRGEAPSLALKAELLKSSGKIAAASASDAHTQHTHAARSTPWRHASLGQMRRTPSPKCSSSARSRRQPMASCGKVCHQRAATSFLSHCSSSVCSCARTRRRFCRHSASPSMQSMPVELVCVAQERA